MLKSSTLSYDGIGLFEYVFGVFGLFVDNNSRQLFGALYPKQLLPLGKNDE